MTHHNVELEAAEAKIAELKAEIARLHEAAQEDNAAIKNLEIDLHTTRRSFEAAEVDWGHAKKQLEDEVRTLKEAVVKLALQQQETPEAPGGNIQDAKQHASPTAPIGTPASPKQTLDMLGKMITAEEAAQEKDWLGE